MKRLLLITHEYPPVRGGIANHLATVVRGLQAYAHIEVAVTPDIAQSVHGPIRRLPSLTWWKNIRQIIDWTSGQEIDALLVSHILPWGTVAAIASFFTKKPYIIFVHGRDIAAASESMHKERLARWILRRAHTVVANSEYTLGLTRALAGNVPGVVVYPNATLTPSGQEKDLRKGHPYALAAGRMIGRKGFRTLVRVMEIVRQTIPDAHVVCVGEGPERAELINDISDLGLEDMITVTSADDAALQNWLAYCRFFILPTQSSDTDPEGFGIVFLEAGAFGKAVIAGGGGGVAEAVADGTTGLIVDARDPNIIARAFVRLWQNPEEAQILGEHGRERVAEVFDPARTLLPLRERLAKL